MTQNSSNQNQAALDKSVALNGQQVKSMIEAGMLWLRTNHQIVNALNVFPVPDGDTGSNMLLTMQAGWQEIAKTSDEHVGNMLSLMARGVLMGARGNSGVILSQFWRGFARATEKKKTLTMETFSDALIEARNTAYKGVVRPVEGTILTVLKDTAEAVKNGLKNCPDFHTLLALTLSASELSLEHTPELLPVLKQAGVVDSGGKGLVMIFEGFLRYFENKPLDENPDAIEIVPLTSMNEEESIEPGQDYEVVVDFIPSNELILSSFYERLSDIGTSIQVGEGEGIYRMHIHVPTDHLYAPINYILGLGTVTKVMIENLIAQMEEIRRRKDSEYSLIPVEEGQIAVVAVSPGEGISKIFASLGAAEIIRGGQTMNPSTEEILTAVNNIPTDKVIVLPNNKNVILAANNAITQSDKRVSVIRSKNVPQGISALMRLNVNGDYDRVVSEMQEALTDIETGEITTATRSVELNGVQVNEGQVIVIHNGELVLATDTVENALIAFLERLDLDNFERITIFSGHMMENDDVEKMVNTVTEKYPEMEVEHHYGGQPHYYLIVSVE